jgi:putative hydrolase of the HAD superfamily
MLSDAMPSILDFMNHWGILSPFDATVISTQLGVTKPNPRMYEAILQRLDAAPGDCLFVDDRIDNLTGAVTAGMQAVQMARPAFLPQVLWDGPVVDSFEAIDRLIEA